MMSGRTNDAIDVRMNQFLVEQHGGGIETPRRLYAKVFYPLTPNSLGVAFPNEADGIEAYAGLGEGGGELGELGFG